jgi:hypothetical protein
MSKLDTMESLLSMEKWCFRHVKSYRKSAKPKGYSGPTLGDLEKERLIPTTDSDITIADFAVRILEKKIAYLESVDAKMFYLNIGMLKDLIIEFEES